MYLDANRIAQTGVKFDQDDKDNLTQLSFVFEAIKSVSESEDFIKTLNELNTIEFKKLLVLQLEIDIVNKILI